MGPELPRLSADMVDVAWKALVGVIGGGVLLRWVSKLFKIRTKEDVDELARVLDERAKMSSEQAERVKVLRDELARKVTELEACREAQFSDRRRILELEVVVARLNEDLELERDRASWWRRKAYAIRRALKGPPDEELEPHHPLYLPEGLDDEDPEKREE